MFHDFARGLRATKPAPRRPSPKKKPTPLRVSMWKKVSKAINTTSAFKVLRAETRSLALDRWAKLRSVVAGTRGLTTFIKSRADVIEHLETVKPTPESDVRDQGDEEYATRGQWAAWLCQALRPTHPRMCACVCVGCTHWTT